MTFGETFSVGCFGIDQARTKEVSKKGRIRNIVSRPEDMIGKVDGVASVSCLGVLIQEH